MLHLYSESDMPIFAQLWLIGVLFYSKETPLAKFLAHSYDLIA